MSGISTHVLDLTRGKPAAGILVRLARYAEGMWIDIASRAADEDGRVRDLPEKGVSLTSGRYQLHFESGEYFRGLGMSGFHPYIEIAFEVADAEQNYHVPLLLTPYGYSTYRGT